MTLVYSPTSSSFVVVSEEQRRHTFKEGFSEIGARSWRRTLNIKRVEWPSFVFCYVSMIRLNLYEIVLTGGL